MNNKPVYEQLMYNILEKIQSGEYRVGEKIMSERKMSELYDLNRLTIRKAINRLIEMGYLNAIHGKGTFVTSIPNGAKKVHFGEDESVSLSALLRQSGFQSSRDVISFKLIEAEGDLSDYFSNCNKVYELIRLSKIDGVPYALQICYFPSDIFNEPERFDFGAGSLYTYMDSQGHMPEKIVSEMEVIIPPDKYKKILDMSSEKLTFYYEYFGYDNNGTMIEFTKSYYKPEYTLFKFVMKRNI